MKFIVLLSVFGIYLLLGIYKPDIFNPIFCPNPLDIIKSFVSLFENRMIIDGLLASFTRITLATLLAIFVSVPLGIFSGLFSKVETIITPFSNSFRFLPITALFPLFIMWFGIGEEMKIIFLFFAVFFFFLPTVLNEVKNVDVDLIETAYTMGMNKLQVIWHVILPSICPTLCQSFITMYGIGWTYVIMAEVINSQSGIGFILNIAASRGRTDIVFVCLFVIIIFSYLFDLLGNIFIRRTFKWKFIKQVTD